MPKFEDIKMRLSLLVLLAILFLLACILFAGIVFQWRSYQLFGASDLDCKILREFPASITVSGRYCLARDLSYTPSQDPKPSSAISIDVGNVELDLMGKCILGPNSQKKVTAFTATQGILIRPGSNYVRIKNGCIAGFRKAISLPQVSPEAERHGIPVYSSRSISIENLILTNNTFRGIQIWAEEAIVRNNHIYDTGGDLTYGKDAFAIGIEVGGNGCYVADNIVRNTFASNSGEGVGISISKGAFSCNVESNTITNTEPPATGRTFGIWGGRETSSPIIVKNNTISLMTYGISGFGILSNNLIVNELCRGKYYSVTDPGSKYVSKYLPKTENFLCLDYLPIALKRLSIRDHNSVFQVASIYHMEKKYDKAYEYYGVASILGSSEASSVQESYRTYKLVSPSFLHKVDDRVIKLKKQIADRELKAISNNTGA